MDLFDPDTYARVRKPLLEAETLPPACYTSHEFYEREVSNIFLKCWNLIGRAEYLKNAGDYFTASLVGVSLIIIHGEDGHIRAFINSCRHRGAKLLEGRAIAKRSGVRTTAGSIPQPGICAPRTACRRRAISIRPSSG